MKQMIHALLRPVLALAVLAAALLSARADEGAARAALSAPGPLVVMMRHALAPGGGDPSGFVLGDCATQRNLSDAGRAQAAAIGAALAAEGLSPDRVLTSRWCRCRETAELLGMETPEGFVPLDSFFSDRSTEPAQTAALREMLAGMGDDEKVVLVTHQVNITALTGVYPSSGEAAVFRPGPGGAPQMIGTILIRP
ncbi:MAG: phosphohistidine phosphatase SixA [Paracoccaceae bacterium]|jgi:phosphohistidine phosphatase SixA